MVFPIISTLHRNFLLTGYILAELNWFCNLNLLIHSWNPTRGFLDVTSFILMELFFANKKSNIFHVLRHLSTDLLCFPAYAFPRWLYIWRNLIDRYFTFAAETDKGSLSIIGPCYLQSSVSGVKSISFVPIVFCPSVGVNLYTMRLDAKSWHQRESRAI